MRQRRSRTSYYHASTLALTMSSMCSRAAAFRMARRSFVRQATTSAMILDDKGGSSITALSEGLHIPSRPGLCIKSVMAPMVALSDYPFRYYLRKYHGVDLCYTQMLHSKNIVETKSFREGHLDLWESGVQYPQPLNTQLNCLGDLPFDPLNKEALGDDGPVIVQLAGHDLNTVIKAANMILEHADGNIDGFDLNLGCPQGIARKGKYGAFLMEEDVDLVCSILSALRKNLPSRTSVSAKIRLPVDNDTLKMRIPKLIATGINYMTIHGRTLHENKTKVAACHIDRIKLAIETAHQFDPNFPVVANGGMETYQDVQNIMRKTGAVAAMSSEALLETPNIFQPSSMDPLSPRELLRRQIGFTRDYLNVCATVAPPLPGLLGNHGTGSLQTARVHMFKFLHRYLQEQPDMRDRLSGQNSVQSLSEARVLLDELHEIYERKSDEELAACPSAQPGSSWYRRHRKPERRVHEREVNAETISEPLKELTIKERKEIVRARISAMKNQKKSGVAKVARFI